MKLFESKFKAINEWLCMINSANGIVVVSSKQLLEISKPNNVSFVSIDEMKSLIYGSALSAAQRAYNLAPSSHREVLLARLYYKTGDIDKATSRVNNVLRRDFSINDK